MLNDNGNDSCAGARRSGVGTTEAVNAVLTRLAGCHNYAGVVASFADVASWISNVDVGDVIGSRSRGRLLRLDLRGRGHISVGIAVRVSARVRRITTLKGWIGLGNGCWCRKIRYVLRLLLILNRLLELLLRLLLILDGLLLVLNRLLELLLVLNGLLKLLLLELLLLRLLLKLDRLLLKLLL